MLDSIRCFLCKSEMEYWRPRKFTKLGRVYCSQECLDKVN